VEALGRALVRPPDLLITELRLPRLDGFALIDRFRTDPVLWHCAIVVVTGSGFSTDVADAAIEVGADALFLKPCDFNALVACAQRLVTGQYVGDSLATARPAIATAEQVREQFRLVPPPAPAGRRR